MPGRNTHTGLLGMKLIGAQTQLAAAMNSSKQTGSTENVVDSTYTYRYRFKKYAYVCVC